MKKLLLPLAVLVLLQATGFAQATRMSPGPVVRSASGFSKGTYTPSAVTMIQSRAKAFGNKTSASGTRYFSVTDSDLAGKKPEEIIQMLSPTIIDDKRVRTVEIQVNLQKPLTLYTTLNQPINIGTATVSAEAANRIDVHSEIEAGNLKIVVK